MYKRNHGSSMHDLGHCAVPAVQDNFEYSFELMKPYIFFRIISLD